MAEIAHVAQLTPWLTISDFSMKCRHLASDAPHQPETSTSSLLIAKCATPVRRSSPLHFLVSVVGNIFDSRRESMEDTEPDFTA